MNKHVALKPHEIVTFESSHHTMFEQIARTPRNHAIPATMFDWEQQTPWNRRRDRGRVNLQETREIAGAGANNFCQRVNVSRAKNTAPMTSSHFQRGHVVSRNFAVACILTVTLSTGLTTVGCNSPKGVTTSSSARSTAAPIAAQSAPAASSSALPVGVPSGAVTPAPGQGSVVKQVNGTVKNVSVSDNTIEIEHDAVESLKLQKGSTVFHTTLPVLRTFKAGDEIIVHVDDSKGEFVVVELLNPKAAPSGFPVQGQGGQFQGQQGIPPQGQGGQVQGAPIHGPGGQPQGQQGAPTPGLGGQPQGPSGVPTPGPGSQPQGQQGAPSPAPR